MPPNLTDSRKFSITIQIWKSSQSWDDNGPSMALGSSVPLLSDIPYHWWRELIYKPLVGFPELHELQWLLLWFQALAPFLLCVVNKWMQPSPVLLKGAVYSLLKKRLEVYSELPADSWPCPLLRAWSVVSEHTYSSTPSVHMALSEHTAFIFIATMLLV